MKTKTRIWCKATKHFTNTPFVGCSENHLLWLHTGNEISLSPINSDNSGYVVQKFTGLKDVDGNEIYEGDILEYRSYEDWGDDTGTEIKVEVRWSDFYLSWALFPLNYDSDGKYAGQQLYTVRELVKIVGNVVFQ
jgi:hypothetical protein